MAFAKQLLVAQDARTQMAKGASTLASAVRVTLGPMGRYACYTSFEAITPSITKDGVSVAEEINLADRYQDAGAQLLKSAASQAGTQMGDGTTTTTVIGAEIIERAVNYLAGDKNPVRVKQGVERAARIAVETVAKHAQPVVSNDHVRFIATISANNDEVLGKTVAEAFKEAGEHGLIRVTEDQRLTDSINVPDGSFIRRGYESPHFVEPGEASVKFTTPTAVIIVEEELKALSNDAINALSAVLGSANVLLMAQDYDKPALDALVNLARHARSRASHGLVAVRNPGYGQNNKDLVEDMMLLSGARSIDAIESLVVNGNVDMAACGYLSFCEVTPERTVFTTQQVDKDAVAERIALLKGRLPDVTDRFQRTIIEERLAMLNGKIVEISVGAISEPEFNERKDRYDDAIRAVVSSREKGYLPGGCTSHILAIIELERVRGELNEHLDFIAGYDCFIEALKTPMMQILANAGHGGDDGMQIYQTVYDKLKSGDVTYGYNAKTEEYVDMVKDGVIDPAKVTIEALGIASSVACCVITTDVLIVDAEEVRK